jgi:HEAT repeat protein
MDFFKKFLLFLSVLCLFAGCSKRIDPAVKALDAPDYRLRQQALIDLYKSGDERAYGLLIEKGLWDEDFFVRRTAIEVLGKMKDKKAVTPLTELYEKDLSVREEIAVALGQIGSDNAVRFLEKLFESSDYLMRGHAIIGLAQLQDRKILPYFYQAVKDESYFVRKKGMEGLKRIEKKSEPRIYKELAKNPHPQIRGYAMEDIGRYGDRGLYRIVRRGLDDKELFVRKKAVLALGMLKSERAIKPLITLLKKDDYLKKDIISALKEIGSKRVSGLFIKMLEDKDIEIRKASIDALGELGEKEAVEPLLSLYEKDPAVKKNVVIALSQITDKRSYEFLKKIAEDKQVELEIRGYAVAGIGIQKGGNEVLFFLEKLLNNKEPEIRINAAKALSKIDDERVIRILEDAVRKEKDGKVIIAYQNALKAVRENIEVSKRKREEREEQWEGREKRWNP